MKKPSERGISRARNENSERVVRRRHAFGFVLRRHRPSDMGYIVHRHGILYSREYGWDCRFEANVAGIVSEFIHRYDPRRDRCWIAERGPKFAGCVFLMKESNETTRLRMLLVEPRFRRRGLGTQLVRRCIGFAKKAGFRRISLWTNDVLLPARRIYERAGFRMVRSAPHHEFGSGLRGETWVLDLWPRREKV